MDYGGLYSQFETTFEWIYCNQLSLHFPHLFRFMTFAVQVGEHGSHAHLTSQRRTWVAAHQDMIIPIQMCTKTQKLVRQGMPRGEDSPVLQALSILPSATVEMNPRRTMAGRLLHGVQLVSSIGSHPLWNLIDSEIPLKFPPFRFRKVAMKKIKVAANFLSPTTYYCTSITIRYHTPKWCLRPPMLPWVSSRNSFRHHKTWLHPTAAELSTWCQVVKLSSHHHLWIWWKTMCFLYLTIHHVGKNGCFLL